MSISVRGSLLMDPAAETWTPCLQSAEDEPLQLGVFSKPSSSQPRICQSPRGRSRGSSWLWAVPEFLQIPLFPVVRRWSLDVQLDSDAGGWRTHCRIRQRRWNPWSSCYCSSRACMSAMMYLSNVSCELICFVLCFKYSTALSSAFMLPSGGVCEEEKTRQAVARSVGPQTIISPATAHGSSDPRTIDATRMTCPRPTGPSAIGAFWRAEE